MAGEQISYKTGPHLDPLSEVAMHSAGLVDLQRDADQVDDRAAATEGRAAGGHARNRDLERRTETDRSLIAELQADALMAHERMTHLEEALRTSRTIGAAVGIVMSRHGLSEQDAFEMLRRASMNVNRKLRDVAEDVLATGDIASTEGD